MRCDGLSLQRSRRSVVQGIAWSAPALLAIAAAPAVAASPGACRYNYASGTGAGVWTTATDTPPRGVSSIAVPRTGGGATTTVSFAATTSNATLDPTYNLAFGNRGTNTVSSTGTIGNDPAMGVIFNLTGGATAGVGSETVTVSFSKPVSGLSFHIRDLTWYKAVPGVSAATAREFVSFSVPTVITNTFEPNEDGYQLNTSGSVPEGTHIYRAAQGTPANDTNHHYYDILVSIAGPISSFSLDTATRG